MGSYYKDNQLSLLLLRGASKVMKPRLFLVDFCLLSFVLVAVGGGDAALKCRATCHAFQVSFEA